MIFPSASGLLRLSYITVHNKLPLHQIRLKIQNFIFQEKDVLADMEIYIAGMEKILEKVDAFYVANKLKHP